MKRAPIVTVFGSSRPAVGSPAYAQAHALGRLIAERGWKVCNGGYGGTMEASAKGAAEAGGHTIGVTCTALARGGANDYIRQEVPTFDLLARLNTLVRLGRAYVVLPGGTGTLLELALVWEMMNKKLLRRKGMIVVLLGDYWASTVNAVVQAMPDVPRPAVAQDVEAAVDLIATSWASADEKSDENPSMNA